MSDPGTVSVFALRALAGVLAALRVDVPSTFAGAGIAPAVLDDRDTRIPAGSAFLAFEEAARVTGDPDFALHAAERIPFGAVGFLDYHARSAPTIREALARVIRFYALVNDRTEAAVEIADPLARVVQRSRGAPTVPRQIAEFQIAMIVARGRLFAGGDWPLHRVGFAHPAPASDAEHRRFFRTNVVRFGEPADEIVFDAAFLDTPLPTADPMLAAVLERYGEDLVARLPAGDPFPDDARRAIADLLRDGEPSIEAVAARLGTTRRTLQRRLHAIGTTHQDLVSAVRRDLALRWLEAGRMSITEVAYLLGFSEPAAFHRAFKRWTGQTAAEWRRAHAPRPSIPPPPFSSPPTAPIHDD